jgi:hypothetical protein
MSDVVRGPDHPRPPPRSGAKANDSFTKVCGTSLTSLPQYTGQVTLGDYGREKAQKAQRKQGAGFLRFLCLFVAKCSAPVLSPRVLAPDLGTRRRLVDGGRAEYKSGVMDDLSLKDRITALEARLNDFGRHL